MKIANVAFIATGLEAAVANLATAARNMVAAAKAAKPTEVGVIDLQLRSLELVQRVLLDLAHQNRQDHSHFFRSSLTPSGEPGEFPPRH
ncbi:MAG: hypothetical protein C0504_00215 [Candidatus Solibacter sp.]|nr:hypothetical protein [Candidatus Solibacter sp.]